MSIVAFKKKSVIRFGANVSGKPPGGIWLSQGPFGNTQSGLQFANTPYGPKGFSLNGSHRNVGYIGKTYHMSKQGTRFRGTQPYGSGGIRGTYPSPLPVYNVNEVIVLADQYMYVKPTVLTTYGMLRKKYRWAYNGKYPNYWVKQAYTGNQVDSASQGVYLQRVSAANTCSSDINESFKFVKDTSRCGPTLCSTSTAKFKYNDMARNAPFTKYTKNPISSSVHTLQIQRKCANPSPEQRPWPPTVNGGACTTGGVSILTHLNPQYNTEY